MLLMEAAHIVKESNREFSFLISNLGLVDKIAASLNIHFLGVDNFS